MTISRKTNTASKFTKQFAAKIVGRNADRFMPQMAAYTTAMLRELDANVYKGDYRAYTPQELIGEVESHLEKFKESLQVDEKTRSLEYAADVGNLMFMTADKLNLLSEANILARREEPDYVSKFTLAVRRLLSPYVWFFGFCKTHIRLIQSVLFSLFTFGIFVANVALLISGVVGIYDFAQREYIGMVIGAILLAPVSLYLLLENPMWKSRP